MDDRTFYRQYLNPDGEPVGSSSFSKIITGTMATVGIALGLRSAYQKGALKKQMEFLIDALGSYRETKVGSYSKGLEDWLSADRVNSALEQKGLLRKGISIYGALSDLPKHIRAREIDREFRNVRMQKSPIIPDKKFELIDYIKQYEGVLNRYKRGETGGGFDEKRALLRFKELAQEEMDKEFHKLLAFNKKEQELMLQRTGYRQATVRDVWDYLGEHEKKMLQEFEKKLAGRKASYSVMDKIIDKNILVKVDADGQIQRFADLRDYKSAMHRLLKTATDDFTIPFIKINPLRMFYVHKLIKDETPIVFADLSKSRVQPFITKNGMPFLSNYSVYVNGKVFTAKATWDEERKQIGEVFLKEFEKPGLLINLKRDADKSLLARQTRNMMNLYDSEHMKIEYVDSDNWFKKYIVKPISKALDLGYQNEPIGHNPEIGDPLSYASGIARWIHNKLKPYKEVRVDGSPFGDYAEWLFVPRHQTIEEIQKKGGSVKDYFAQFYAARNNPEDVTTTSFFLYTFAERLNATLNQVGLGLSAKHLGSAPQILSNLTMKRIFPVLLTVEGFKYSNYLYEQYAGDEYEDQLANMFVNTQFFMADVFDNLGLTEKFKKAKDLFVGYNFISELPVPVLTTEGLTPIQLGDLLPLDKTREELEEYYETGKEPVRKGRYWQTGNTPFIGSKIEYWRPNWYQRITSDWQYTDTLWGSKEEYWDNHFLISPLNHFLLDPYHWEKKWYYDRPYPITGGIAEIEAIPLIGPLLDRTVGQILKPTQIMHSDEWLNPDKGNEKIGFQIAKALGIIEEKIGGAMVNGGIVQSVDGLTGSTAYHGVDIMSHISSGVRTYDEYDAEHSPIAYVTASGNVKPLRMTELYDKAPIQSILSQGVSINRVGLSEDVSVEEGVIAYEEEAISPASIHSALTDFYYNTSEMAGFYGWISSLGLKNPMDQYDPKWMTSSKAYGYERAFWDKGYGNLGADAMEIFRRFVPRDEHKNYINLIDNRMPSWLPDGDYFINFQKGDPYVLVKQGEMRLPGEAYEKLYGIDRDKLMEMSIGSSFIGYDIPEIIDHLLKRDKVKSDAFQEILDKGSELHKEYEKYFDELGIATKVEKDVEDPTHHVKGTYDMMVDTKKIIEWAKANDVEMYYYGAAIGDGSEEYEGYYYSPVVIDDQMAQELIERSPELTADIKTRGQNQFDKKQLKFENTQQVNFYARHTGTQVNAVVEYNRDDPTAKPRIYMFDYNPYLYDYSMKKVETARAMVRQMIEDGAIGVGDLYSIVDRYRILADVAPYSEEFRNLKKQLSMMDLEEEEKEEIRKINEYVQQQKDPLPTYDYRFKTANVRDVSVTVTKIVDNNTFYTEEFGDHPIRLAGVFVPSGKDEEGQQATEFVRKYLKEGMRIQIAIDADAGVQDLFNDDTYESISAVVRVGNIRNLNRELIERGLAKEKENDYSPAGVHARFSPEEIVIGKAWETFAHLDTPIHTKLLQVRSPLEQYERRDIYGKNFQSWDEPFDDYFIPWYQNWISKSPLAAVTLGTAIGSLFGNTRKGKVIGAAIGFLATSLGVGYRTIYESLSGKAWIPERREKEREIETYMDALKFVKYRKLYEETAKIALKEEGFDVKAFIEGEKASGDNRQGRLKNLMNIKQRLASGDYRAIAEATKYVGLHLTMDGYIKAINKEINEIKNERKAEYIPEIAAQAIAYYQEAETTMYAYDPGDPLDKALKALPHKERIYVKKFMDAPHEERQRILEIAPWYVRRILQSHWGLPVDEKPDLIQLFSKYELPDEQWLGWDPRANLEDIKLKIVKKEGLELSEFNLWPEDEKRARFVNNDHVPQWRQGLDVNEVKERLRRILGEAGVENLLIEVEESKKPGIQVNMDIKVDRRKEVVDLMNQNRDSLI